MSEPMSGLPDDHIEQAKRALQSAVRGDDAWRHPDLDIDPNAVKAMGFEPDVYDDPDETDPANMAAPTPEVYKHAHAFMSALFGPDGYTPDSIGQLVEGFVPCLRIMVERPYEPRGALWRKAGVFGPLLDAYKKWDRFFYRTWTKGVRHDDSGFDLVNFVIFTLRSDPDSRFGELGEPAPPEATEDES